MERNWNLVGRVLLVLTMSTAVSQVLAQAAVAELPLLARQMGLSFAIPDLEGLRMDTLPRKRLRQPTQLSWQHTGAQEFEIYVQLLPETTRPLLPHVLSGVALTDCARNSEAEEDFIARYQAGEDDLERLGADWAAIWAFRPKPAFSGRAHALQVSYYREGIGLVNLWLLADERELLNGAWAYVLPFVEGVE